MPPSKPSVGRRSARCEAFSRAFSPCSWKYGFAAAAKGRLDGFLYVMKVPFLDLSLQHRAIREQALAALTATYDATRFCLGKDVEDFEAAFARTLGYPQVLGLNSGTSPLHLAAALAGWGPGDEVIAPPFTFISTVWGISYVGAKPVFVDIEKDTFNLDPAKIEAAITPRTKGIVAVHLFGRPAKLDAIMAIARKHGLFVVEDCAQAVGAAYMETPVGLTGTSEPSVFIRPKISVAAGRAERWFPGPTFISPRLNCCECMGRVGVITMIM